MSQPEISRRCLSCGASVRAGARFCPQCGALMNDGASASPGENQTTDAAAGRGAVAGAPSPREVASAFETWREEARRPPRARAEGPEKREGEADDGARALSEESQPRPGVALKEAAGGAAEPPTPPAPAAGRGGVDEVAGVSNVAASAGRGAASAEARRGRAGAVVKENIMPRVERMREEALIVLEETPDDAGLRFVAAAVVLFLLFLLFLFLSTVLK